MNIKKVFATVLSFGMIQANILVAKKESGKSEAPKRQMAGYHGPFDGLLLMAIAPIGIGFIATVFVATVAKDLVGAVLPFRELSDDSNNNNQKVQNYLHKGEDRQLDFYSGSFRFVRNLGGEMPKVFEGQFCNENFCECLSKDSKLKTSGPCVRGNLCSLKDQKMFCKTLMLLGDDCESDICFYFPNPLMESNSAGKAKAYFEKDKDGIYKVKAEGSCKKGELLYVKPDDSVACGSIDKIQYPCTNATCTYDRLARIFFSDDPDQEDENIGKTFNCVKGQTVHNLMFPIAMFYPMNSETLRRALKFNMDMRRFFFETSYGCSDGKPFLKPLEECKSDLNCLYQTMTTTNEILQVVCRKGQTAVTDSFKLPKEVKVSLEFDMQFLACISPHPVSPNDKCQEQNCICTKGEVKDSPNSITLMERDSICLEKDSKLVSAKIIKPDEVCLNIICRCLVAADSSLTLDTSLYRLCVKGKDAAGKDSLMTYQNLIHGNRCLEDKCVCGGWKGKSAPNCSKGQLCKSDGSCAADQDIMLPDGIIVKKTGFYYLPKGSSKSEVGETKTDPKDPFVQVGTIRIKCQRKQFWGCIQKNKCGCFNKDDDENKGVHYIVPGEICLNRSKQLKCQCRNVRNDIEVPTGAECVSTDGIKLEVKKHHTFLQCLYQFHCPETPKAPVKFDNENFLYLNLESKSFETNKPSSFVPTIGIQ